MVLASRYIENTRGETDRPLDALGFLLSAPGLSLVMLGLATAGRHLVSAQVSLGCIALGALALPGYAAHARRCPHALLDLGLFRVPTYSVAVLGGSLFRTGIGAIPFLLPLMLQLGFGLTPFQSGLLTYASADGSMCMKTVSRRILRGLGFRRVLSGNVVISAASLAAISLFRAQTPHLMMVLVLLAGGCFCSLQFTNLNALAYAEIETARVSAATSLASVMQQLSLSMGVTIGAYALQLSAYAYGDAHLGARDFAPAFGVIALLALSSLVHLRRLAPDAGAEIAGRAHAAE